MIKKAVIPAAGLGTRMLPLTKSQPKEMLPLGRKPCIQYIIEELADAGVKQVLIITGYKKRAIEDHFDDDLELNKLLSLSEQKDLLNEVDFNSMGISFYFTRQSKPSGLGDAIRCAKCFVDGDPFIVALGDSIIYSEEEPNLLKRMIAQYEKYNPSIVLGTRTVPLEDVSKYGIVKPVSDIKSPVAEIEDVVEKPMPQNAPSNLAFAARYILPADIFNALERTGPGKGGEIQLTDAIRILLKEGMKGYSVQLTEREKRYDIGNIPSYYEAFVDFALDDEKYGYQLRQYLIKKLKL